MDIKFARGSASVNRVQLFFLIVLASLLALNGVFRLLPLRPVGVHMWAMCDRASVARNYYQESMNFFEPRVHETREYDGITGLEFPLVSYLAAVLYTIFGFHEFFYRGLMLLLLCSGLLFAFRMSLRFTGNAAAATIPPLLLLASPVLNYYSASFIPDVASLGFILMAWFVFFSYRENGSPKMLLLLFLFMSLACLIKITSVISLVVMLILLLLDKTSILRNVHGGFRKHGLQSATLLLAAFTAVAWYRYASWLSNEHHCGVFLMHSRPALNAGEVMDVLSHINDIWLSFYFPKFFNFFILTGLFAFVAFSGAINRILWLVTCGLWCGNILFFLFMLHQFRDHDYYIIPLLPALFFMWLSLADLFVRKVQKPLYRISALAGAVVLLVVASFKVKDHIDFRHNKDNWLYTWGHFSDLIDIEPFVDRIGIGKNEKVMAVYDRSPNIVLYYLNRKGWSVPPDAGYDELAHLIGFSPDWLVTNDTATIAKDGLAAYFESKPERKGNVLFYRKRK